MKEKSKKYKKALLLGTVAIFLAGASYAYYLYNLPKRDVAASEADYSYKASEVVNEYLSDPTKANQKFLDAEGVSKILMVNGTIASIDEDYNGQVELLLKEEQELAGVSCTLLSSSGTDKQSFKLGQKVMVKGVIRSGAAYDEDLDMYENVILEKCTIIN
ncbi:OB-fold protein [Arcticibacterium luteifluviistationis]|uniref:tRNA_anti-like n=1 Tax=Arcticibacterium luteifluviistationis TaxID=1784714 RepID=A0A2Z4GBG8_9BACT|nr:hypothetical protein [Arcticibacterium luteifluviistationis]AWV98471.1 hypothetical protein DJ013_09925 [Arcticibacterium luteifluviistationis]